MAFPSSPTGNGEKRGMEYAGQPGEPLALRPARATANDAKSLGSHTSDSEFAADGKVDMRDSGSATAIHSAPPLQDLSFSKSADGNPDMKAKPIR